jgi:hypothetical protein
MLTVLAFSALPPSSTVAAEYSVTGVPANSSVPIAPTAPVTSRFKVELTAGLTLSCGHLNILFGVIINFSKRGKAQVLNFSSCEDLTEPTKCALNTIETKPISITLEDTVGGKTIEVFKPESGTEFTKILLKNKTGQSCENEANLSVRGLFVTEPENNSSVTTRHPFSVAITAASKLLIVAENAASFEGAGELLLQSGGTFSLLV